MKHFMEWQIKKALNKGSELYIRATEGDKFDENAVESDIALIEDEKIYTVVHENEEEETIVLQDEEGHTLELKKDDLATALAKRVSENSTLRGFQALQYPVGYMMAGSATELAKLSIYDSRLKGKKLGEGPPNKMVG